MEAGVRGHSGQGAWRRGAEAVQPLIGQEPYAGDQEGAPEGTLSWVTRVTLGSINIWHSQALLGDACCVRDGLLFRARILECHLAIHPLINSQSGWNLPIYIKRTGQRAKSLTGKPRRGHKWSCW